MGVAAGEGACLNPLALSLQGPESESDPADRGPDVPGAGQLGGAEAAAEHHQPADGRGLLGAVQDAGAVSMHRAQGPCGLYVAPSAKGC